MTLIVCLDDRNGMLFNRRRQSKDSVLCEQIAALAGDKLFVNVYSSKLFPEANVCQNPLACADEEGYCFVEDLDVLPYLHRAEKLIIYRWNRHYPADVTFPVCVLESWRLVEQTDFAGNSHDTITREVYVK